LKEQDEPKDKVRFLFEKDVTAEKILEAIKAHLGKATTKDNEGDAIPAKGSAPETDGEGKL
jgi:hypothetical protein